MSTAHASMRPFAFTSAFAPARSSIRADGAIEWEELPSLAETLAERMAVLGPARRGLDRRPTGTGLSASGLVWDSTRPAALEPVGAIDAFHEPLLGLSVREVREPDVFRHFFGALKGV